MDTGYKESERDLTEVYEPATNGHARSNEFLNYTCKDGTTLGTKLSKESYDAWNQRHTLSYRDKGSSRDANFSGTVPLPTVNGQSTAFYTLTALGDTSISFDSGGGLSIGSVHFPSSLFRTPPKRVGVIFCGGGGGACGMGVSAGDKYGYNRAPSAGGGGGAIVEAVLHQDHAYLLHLGDGGAGGTDVDHSGQKSDGAAGGQSYLQDMSGYGTITYANGGGGSHDSIGSSGYTIQAGICGDGGTVTGSLDGDNNYYVTLYGSGAPGNDWYNSQRGGNNVYVLFSEIGGEAKLYSNANTDCYASSSDGYRAAHFGGGSSIGRGGNESTAPGYGGGGSTKSRKGGQGCAIFFY